MRKVEFLSSSRTGGNLIGEIREPFRPFKWSRYVASDEVGNLDAPDHTGGGSVRRCTIAAGPDSFESVIPSFSIRGQ